MSNHVKPQEFGSGLGRVCGELDLIVIAYRRPQLTIGVGFATILPVKLSFNGAASTDVKNDELGGRSDYRMYNFYPESFPMDGRHGGAWFALYL